MPYAAINGIELYYESHGKGVPVVFAHGAGGNHLSWWQQIPVFARRFRCITFDHRAFGLSRDGNGEGQQGRRMFHEDLRAFQASRSRNCLSLYCMQALGWMAAPPRSRSRHGPTRGSSPRKTPQ